MPRKLTFLELHSATWRGQTARISWCDAVHDLSEGAKQIPQLAGKSISVPVGNGLAASGHRSRGRADRRLDSVDSGQWTVPAATSG